MGVDQAGRGQQARAVDPLRGGVVRRQRPGANRRDPVAADDEITGGGSVPPSSAVAM